MATHWKVDVFKMVKLPTKHMTSYKKVILDSFEFMELNPTYNEIQNKIDLHWDESVQFEMTPISNEAQNSNLFEL